MFTVQGGSKLPHSKSAPGIDLDFSAIGLLSQGRPPAYPDAGDLRFKGRAKGIVAMAKAGLLDLAIAPLTLLERTKGWRRRGLILLYLLVASVVGVVGYRELSLWRLPNIGEPFDTAKFGTVNVPDRDNALPLYLEAEKQLKPFSREAITLNPKAWEVQDWTTLDPVIRNWVEENRPALESWLRATERSDALLAQPETMTISTNLTPVQGIRNLARLATLEGSRREQAGDLGGAWEIYRGVLRSSRHAGRHGGTMQRWTGQAILTKVKPMVLNWIELPAVTPDQLRRAIKDVEACQGLTSPNSAMIQAEYFMCRDVLNKPDEWKKFDNEGPEGDAVWYNQIPILVKGRHFLFNEPKRSLRVHDLLMAGLLAQCDRPRAVRPKLFNDKYMIYQVDSHTPAAVASLTPESLTAWADNPTYFSISNQFNHILARLDFEQATFDQFRLKMAERAFQIEKGHPAKTYGDLVGPYLKELPEGVEPGDSVGASP